MGVTKDMPGMVKACSPRYESFGFASCPKQMDITVYSDAIDENSYPFDANSKFARMC